MSQPRLARCRRINLRYHILERRIGGAGRLWQTNRRFRGVNMTKIGSDDWREYRGDDAERLAIDNKRLIGIISDREKELDVLRNRLEFKENENAELRNTVKELLSKTKGQ
jgi:hypothetical protein